jgi:hypothetical protein
LPLECGLVGQELRHLRAAGNLPGVLLAREFDFVIGWRAEYLPVIEPEPARQEVGPEFARVAVRAGQHAFANRARRNAIHPAQRQARELRGTSTQPGAHPQLAGRIHPHLERKQCAPRGQVRARLAAPVEETHEQVTVGQQRVQGGEQTPCRVAIQWRRVRQRCVHVLDGTFEPRDVCRMRQLGGHVVQRAIQLREVGAQLHGRELRAVGARRAARQHADQYESAPCQRPHRAI